MLGFTGLGFGQIKACKVENKFSIGKDFVNTIHPTNSGDRCIPARSFACFAGALTATLRGS